MDFFVFCQKIINKKSINQLNFKAKIDDKRQQQKNG